jgi:hypothetical protein
MPDMTLEVFAGLVACLRRLKHLCLPMYQPRMRYALLIVGHAGAPLEHLELGPCCTLSALCCVADAPQAKSGLPVPLFPKLQALTVARLSTRQLERLFRFYASAEHSVPDYAIAACDGGISDEDPRTSR